jgi:hypothetical protein
MERCGRSYRYNRSGAEEIFEFFARIRDQTPGALHIAGEMVRCALAMR